MIKIWQQDIRRQDCADWVKQINYYRIGTEEKEKIKIDEMRIQAIVRDGGLQIATTRGLDKKVYLIPIPKIEDKTIRKYFISKKNALLKSMRGEIEPPLCNEDERWNGNKCQNYCAVKSSCSYGKAEKWVKNDK